MIMKKKTNRVGYVNPALVEVAVEVLKIYALEHPESTTPMADYCRLIDAKPTDHGVYLSAARRLGWSVIRSGGNIYENGIRVW